jgi:allantoinase
MLTIRGERVVLPDGVRAASLLVRDGRIARIGDWHETATGIPVVDAGELVVLPGLVDSHVHINEPGRTEWEGFQTATRAAAAGGVTTIVDMPLNSIPATTDAEAFRQKIRAAEGRCHVDVGFWGGVVPGNAGQLEALARLGVLGFKCFLSPSGVEEFEHVSEPDLREAMPVVARLGLPLLVHAEWPAELVPVDPRADPRAYATWLASRPPRAEAAAIELLVRLAREFGTRVHIVHVASGEAVEVIRAARAEGLTITAETCPHYLAFCAEEIADGATAFKCAPTIRERRQQESLWRALDEGVLDLVASDHSPAPASLKSADIGDFVQAWGGIASLQIGLSAVWTAARDRGIGIDRLARWMTHGPAVLAGLDRIQGRIAVGYEANLAFWDPDKEYVVDAGALEHRHPVTPYHGRRLRGRVHRTLLRGETVYDEGRFGNPSGVLRLDRSERQPN